jgi:hypothetical protein
MNYDWLTVTGLYLAGNVNLEAVHGGARAE